MYQQFLRPFLTEHEEWVDARLATIQGLLVSYDGVRMPMSLVSCVCLTWVQVSMSNARDEPHVRKSDPDAQFYDIPEM